MWLFAFYDVLVCVTLALFMKNYLIVSFSLFFLLVLLNLVYFYILFDLRTVYRVEMSSNHVLLVTKRGKVLKRFDVCSLIFPVINLKKELWNDFMKKNKNVNLYLHDRLGNRYSIGRGVFVYGHTPMSEAIDLEKWLQKQKEKICRKNKER